MTIEELNYIKDAFSQIIEDIAGNTDWHEAARAVASDLGTLERELEEKVASLPSNLDEAAEEYAAYNSQRWFEGGDIYYDRSKIMDAFIAGAEWMAAQGETIDGEILTTSDYGWETIRIPKKLYPLGTEVTVQIRKKQ